MEHSRRQVSALLLFLALIAGACSSDPSEVVVGDDTGEVAMDEAGEADDAAEQEAADAMSDDSDSVAGDSAPFEVPKLDSNAIAELMDDHDLATAQWAQNGITSYDYSVRVLTPDGPMIGHIEVRNGKATRIISEFEELDEPITIEAFMAEFRGEFKNGSTGIHSVNYADGLGYPKRVEGFENGQPMSFEIYRLLIVSADEEPCSADGLTYPSPTGTDPVSVTHARLLEAAQACDYLALTALADEGANELTTSFGGGDPIEFLREGESNGENFLAILAELLQNEPTPMDEIAVWPEAFADPDLEYLDWRVGIEASSGEWLFFVAGD